MSTILEELERAEVTGPFITLPSGKTKLLLGSLSEPSHYD
jgi:hypothetical protein